MPAKRPVMRLQKVQIFVEKETELIIESLSRESLRIFQ